MTFEIIAEREIETVRMKSNSSLITLAKARVWASEGWDVTVVVDDQESPGLGGEFAPPWGSARAIPEYGFEP
jgi:hypothetical protein